MARSGLGRPDGQVQASCHSEFRPGPALRLPPHVAGPPHHGQGEHRAPRWVAQEVPRVVEGRKGEWGSDEQSARGGCGVARPDWDQDILRRSFLFLLSFPLFLSFAPIETQWLRWRGWKGETVREVCVVCVEREGGGRKALAERKKRDNQTLVCPDTVSADSPSVSVCVSVCVCV